MVRIGGDISGLTDALSESETRLGKFGKQMSSIGQSATMALTLPIVGVGAAIIKTGMDFEQAMSNVTSLMSPAEKAAEQTSKAMHDLAIKMGAETKFGAVDAAKGIEELIKAGVSAEAIMSGGLKGALDLAVAGEIDLASAAEIASTALNAFKKDNITVTQAANILAGSANASATSVSELKFALSASASVAAAVGLSFKDTATMLSVFAQSGLKGSDAGTSLKTMMMNLIPQTKQQIAMFQKLNLMTDKGTSAFFDNTGKLKSARDIADLMKRSMSHLTDEQRLSTMETLFGSDAIRGANILYEAGAAGIDNMAEAMGKVTAADTAAEKMNNLKGAIEKVKGSIETFAVKIYELYSGDITKFITKIDEWIGKMDDVSPSTLKMGINIALLVAAIGPALMVIGSMASGVSAIASALALVNPAVGLTVLALLALTAAFTTLYNTNDEAKAKMDAIWVAVAAALKATWETIKATALEVWASLKAFWATNGEEIKQGLLNIWTSIKWVLENEWNIIKGVAEAVFNSLKGFWDQWGATIKTLFGTMATDVGSIFGNIAKFIVEKVSQLAVFWNEIWPQVQEAFTNVWNNIWFFIEPIIGGIVELFNTAWPAISELMNKTWENIKTIINAAIGIIEGVIKTFTGLFTGNWKLFWEGIKQTAENIWKLIFGVIKMQYDAISGGIKIAFLAIYGYISGAWKTVAENTRSMWEGIGKTISNVWTSIGSGIKNEINYIIGLINGFITKVNSIKISIPSVNIPGVGTVGGGTISMPQIPNIPMLATGTNFFPQDGPAFLHKGEAVVPKKYNNTSTSNSSDNVTNVYLDGQLIYSSVDSGMGRRMNALGAGG